MTTQAAPVQQTSSVTSALEGFENAREMNAALSPLPEDVQKTLQVLSGESVPATLQLARISWGNLILSLLRMNGFLNSTEWIR